MVYPKDALGDNLSGVNCKAEPSQVIMGSQTILTEACAVPGKLKRIKKYLLGIIPGFFSNRDPVAVTIRQNQRGIQHLPQYPHNTAASGKDRSLTPGMWC
jgi:hypothetical protein